MKENELLIDAGEVISLAFPGNTGVTGVSITDTLILSSQEKYIKPVLNGLFDPLLKGKYADLLDTYVKPAMAYYIKGALISHIAYSYGDMGITVLKSANLEVCTEKELAGIKRSVRAEAKALLKRAVEYIESNPDSFPEYDPKLNIMNRVNIGSQIVL